MRFRAVDSFRGIAALMVILFHLQHLSVLSWNKFITGSDIFVDFFFVLSGFVITHSNLSKITGLASVWPFMLKRLRRIYPLHLFTLLLVLSFETFRFVVDRFFIKLSHPVFAHHTLPSLVANLTLTQSLGLLNDFTWNVPSWSISAEYYVYMLWALSIVLFRKNVVLLSVVNFSLIAWFIVTHGGNIIYHYNYGFIRCGYGFLIGMVAYLLNQRMPGGFARPVSSVIEALLLLLTIAFVQLFTHPTSWLMPLWFAVVIACFSRENGAVAQFFAADRLRFLGKLSYSYYLNHAVVLAAVDMVVFRGLRLPHSPVGECVYIAVCLILVHGLSLFTYRHIEFMAQPKALDVPANAVAAVVVTPG